jgi:hypothetical protein
MLGKLAVYEEDHKANGCAVTSKMSMVETAVAPNAEHAGVGLGSRASVFGKLTVRLVCPQLRKCPVRFGSYAWCHQPTLGHTRRSGVFVCGRGVHAVKRDDSQRRKRGFES